MARRRQPGQPSRSNRRRPVSEASRAATPGVAAPQPVSSSRRCLSGRSRRRTQPARLGSDVTTTDARHLDATRPDVRDDQIRLARAGPAGRGGRQRLLHRAHSSANRTTHRGDQQVALPRSSGRRHPHEHRIHGVRRERQVRGQQPQQVYASEVVAHDAVTHRLGRGGATGPCCQRGPPSDLPAVASPAQHRQFADHRAGPRLPGPDGRRAQVHGKALPPGADVRTRAAREGWGRLRSRGSDDGTTVLIEGRHGSPDPKTASCPTLHGGRLQATTTRAGGARSADHAGTQPGRHAGPAGTRCTTRSPGRRPRPSAPRPTGPASAGHHVGRRRRSHAPRPCRPP